MTGALQIEAVLLTGGASSRMAEDKASVLVGGVPLGERIAAALAEGVERVTVLGRKPISGYAFLEDADVFAGPLVALAQFNPTLPYFFVASCDLAAFDGTTVGDLAARIGQHQAAIPELDGRLQPLCALYRSDALSGLGGLVANGERRVMQWVRSLDAVVVPDRELHRPGSVRNVNTPDELRDALRAREQDS